MPVVNVCPACQRKVRVPRKVIGQTVRCPACSATFEATADEPTPPPSFAPDAEEVPEPSSEAALPISDGGRVEVTGAGLLALAEGLLAVALALQLIVALIQLATADSSPRALGARAAASSVPNSLTQMLALVWVMSQVGATAVLLVGAVFCVVTAANPPLRARAGSVLLLAAVSVLMSAGSFGDLIRGAMGGDLSGGFRGASVTESALAGQVLVMSMTPLVIGAALQAMVAVYARCHARRLRDAAAEQLARGLAIAYPAVVIGIFVLLALAGIFGSQSHPTFDQVMMVLDRLFRTAFVAATAFVLWRVWTGLRSA